MLIPQTVLRNSVVSGTAVSQNIGSDPTVPLIRLTDVSQSALIHEKSARSAPYGWPLEPAVVKYTTGSTVLHALIDSILLALSAAFLIFGLVVRAYDQSPVSEHEKLSQSLLSAARYGPTVFPILFAAIVGRATHAILVWRLEKGERVGVLDVLAGSTSLTSTVISQLSLGYITLFGATLIVVWVLSPIGGQASLRQVRIGTNTEATPVTLKFYQPNGDMGLYDSTSRDVYYGTTNSMFGASLVSSNTSRSAPADLWGNVKIPMVERYENDSVADDQGWYVARDDQNVYASLAGIVTSIEDVNAGQQNAMYDFGMETSYIHTQCLLRKERGNVSAYGNVGFAGAFLTNDPDSVPPDSERRVAANANLSQRSILFGLRDYNRTIQCNLTSTFVELQVRCNTSSTCAVSRIRRSRRDNPVPAFTVLDNDYDNAWKYTAYGFVNSVTGNDYVSTALTEYVYEDDDRSGRGMFLAFNQLLNTYINCLYTLRIQANGLLANTTGNSTSPSYGFRLQLNNIISTEATRTIRFDVIQCEVGWTVALCIASTAMVLGVLLTSVTHHFHVRSPDILLNFSSLAMRESPCLPDSGTYMHASTRAKLLRNVRVQSGDISGDHEIGKLAIRSIGQGRSQEIVSVQRGRLYE